MNRLLKFGIDIVQANAYLSTPFGIVFAILLLMLPAEAQFAPSSLAFPSNITWAGTSLDSNYGLVQESADIQVTSATAFSALPGGGGTYTYSKIGPNTGTLAYVFNYSEPGYTETENGTVLLTFASAAGGTFTSSGSYSGNNVGVPFSGTFTNGMGTFTYTAPNTAPTISNVTDKSTNEDTATSAIPFTIDDTITDPASLTVTRNSSNTTVVPLANVVLGGSGASRTVTIIPAANQSGTSTITLTVSDGALTASDTFVLTVTAVNDTPTISDVSNLTISKNTATSAVAFTIGDVETAAGSLTVTRASSNIALVPLANVVLGGSGSSRTVTITPATNQTGTSNITVTVSDGTASANDTFVLTVIDGMTLSSWRQTYFSSTANSGDGADLNDFDFDGRVNLMEYALGSLPNNSTITNDPVIATEPFSGQSYLTLTITKPAGITGITYLVEVSNSLNGWNSGPTNTTVITDNATTLKVRDNTPASGGQRFIRLKVTNP